MIRSQAKACATIILLTCCPCAFALNPSLDVSQYAHTSWTVRDGFFKGLITSIAQTPDGYLWLGTEFGLVRFDGVQFLPWQAPPGQDLPSSYIASLLADRDGRLWIGTTSGLWSWKDGKLSIYPELAGLRVGSLIQDREGTIWAGGYSAPTGRLCSIQKGAAHCYGTDGRFGHGVLSLHEDTRGNLWAGALTGLWHWKPGPARLYPIAAVPVVEIRALIEGKDGALLIAMLGGIRRLVDGKTSAYVIPGSGPEARPSTFLRDRDGGLWIGTQDRGLLHLHEGRPDLFGHHDSLSGESVLSLFEDREDSIWVATTEGLDRFRDFAVPAISVQQGLSNDRVWSVLGARDGSVWLGTFEGLNRWNGGKIRVYRKSGGLLDDNVNSLFQDDRGRIWVATLHGVAYFENGRFISVNGLPGGVVHSIVGDNAGSLWIAYQDHDLLQLRGGREVEQTPWAKLGRKDYANTLSPDNLPGGLWLGFLQGGVAHLKDGHVNESFAVADGLGAGIVAGLQLDRDGTLWAATEAGLSSIRDGRVVTLTRKNGLPCDTVHAVIEDDDHSFWLSTACGIVRIGRSELEAWAAHPNRTVRATVFDESDGARSHARASGYSPRATKSADGRLWFVTGEGVSVIDPRHLPVNKLPPPVHIEEIKADRKIYWDNIAGMPASNLHLPALSRDLEIDYTALSLVVKEKVRFRIKLEGRDPDWKDAGNERKAFYNDLPPRHYRFRVMASNNSGVWNEAGDSLDFSIDPAYYQTRWFQVSCVAVFLALIWALYRYRLHQMAQEFNMRLEERVGERTRIARELHDTLLQSFQGLMLRFQVIDELLPPGKAKEALEKALERGDQAIVEGRDAVHDLRSSTVITNDLAEAVKALGDELAAEDSAIFRVVVEGSPRHLHPILRDEIYRIAREALRNAFSHARAREIEAEITYGEGLLRLRIRDDGRGMAAGIVEQGRAGHYGLPGMRERAKRIGGQLNVWTGAGAGTEIELTIPASNAYGTSQGGFIQRLKSAGGMWWNGGRDGENSRKSVASNKEEP